VVYQLYSIEKRLQLRLRVEVPEDDPEVDSIVDLFPCANFLEREVYDLLGIRFKGHPNLKRILLPENWVGHPLRKDYPLEPEEKPLEFIELKKLNEELLKYGIK
jgi:NADH-quinone oxidoreductase subunit C